MGTKPTKEEAAAALTAAAVKDVQDRYGDIVTAAEALRGHGRHDEADAMMTTAQRVLDLDRAQAVAQREMDNYARGHAIESDEE